MLSLLRRTPSASPTFLSRSVLPASTSAAPRRKMTQNAHRPTNWKAAAPPPAPGPTFAAQTSLPRLPVPELSETIAKLKDSMRPIAWSEAEYGEAIKKVDEFASGLGPVLQKRLKMRADEPGREHWLEEWWDDLGYLGYRDSVVINVSYYYGFDDHPSHLPQSAVNRAAAIVRAGMQFRQQYKKGQVKPEGTRDAPFCMDTWRWMFDCCRIPGLKGLDWSVTSAKPGDDGSSGHVIVLRQGRAWKLDAWQNGRLLSVTELEKQLQHIIDGTTHEYPGVGVLTASNRDVWAKDYAHLLEDPQNVKVLEAIHSSAFVLCLDTEQPKDLIEHSRALWHGAVTPSSTSPRPLLGLRNRWVDKPVQFIVFDNAKAGIMGEHSVMDGTPTVTLCDIVLDMIASPSFDQGEAPSTPASLPEPLDWKVTEQTSAAILKAEDAALALVSSQALNIIRTSYGKAAIKAFGVSPDSWAQMIVQLAYARLLNAQGKKREGGTYEAATTRRFLKGRTETIRVVSSESDKWVESMDDPSKSEEERKALFKEVAKRHIATAKMSGAGLGIDRHLLGLKLLRKDGEDSPMFSDPVYQRSSNWVLSTSAVFSKHFQPYGWGEVVPEGFGVAYMTGFDDYLQYTITSRVESSNKEFCDELQKAAEDIYNLHVDTMVSGKSNL